MMSSLLLSPVYLNHAISLTTIEDIQDGEKPQIYSLGSYTYTLGNLKVLVDIAIKISISTLGCVIVNLQKHSHAFRLCFYMQIICVIITSSPGLFTQPV